MPCLPSGAKMMWNQPGTALLVMSFADFDATNKVCV